MQLSRVVHQLDHEGVLLLTNTCIRQIPSAQSLVVICEEEEVVSCCWGHSLEMFNAAAVALALYPFNYVYRSYSTQGQRIVVTDGGVFRLL